MNEIFVFDIEANGFLEDATSIHCISIQSIEEDSVPTTLRHGDLTDNSVYELFNGIDYLVGHNIISYDIPMIKRFYNIDLLKLLGKDAIIDTYLWSRVSFPDRPMPKGCPNIIPNPYGPNKKIGPHGLESWGWRMGERKLEITDWSKLTDEMVERCEVDVSINIKTYFYLCKEMGLDPYNPYNRENNEVI